MTWRAPYFWRAQARRGAKGFGTLQAAEEAGEISHAMVQPVKNCSNSLLLR
jgi:hypothetical protein